MVIALLRKQKSKQKVVYQCSDDLHLYHEHYVFKSSLIAL